MPTVAYYRDSAVLLCNSIGHEYIRSHRALKQLAIKLADMGYYVLRFDYNGVGDSSGDFDNVNLADWQDNIMLASEELRAISGQHKITVIGLRVGATLSLLSSEQCKFNSMILWDPVVSGKQFVSNLMALHKQLLVDRMWFVKDRSEDDTPGNEYLGYKYSDNVIHDFEKIFFSAFNMTNNAPVNAVCTSAGEMHDLNRYADQNTDKTSFAYVEDMGNWQELKYIDSSLTATNVLHHICEILK
ncbi:MAG: alpha/beta hydrolase [Gammaproteobacteria bacterium]|nr:alpha/beta hydrolase [Gammaproteobacteria bacterium]